MFNIIANMALIMLE